MSSESTDLTIFEAIRQGLIEYGFSCSDIIRLRTRWNTFRVCFGLRTYLHVYYSHFGELESTKPDDEYVDIATQYDLSDPNVLERLIENARESTPGRTHYTAPMMPSHFIYDTACVIRQYIIDETDFKCTELSAPCRFSVAPVPHYDYWPKFKVLSPLGYMLTKIVVVTYSLDIDAPGVLLRSHYPKCDTCHELAKPTLFDDIVSDIRYMYAIDRFEKSPLDKRA